MHKNSVEGGWIQVDVRGGETLYRIARLLEIPLNTLLSLNSHYKHGIIPNKKSLYSIIIPKEKVYVFYLLYELQNKTKIKKEIKGYRVNYNVQVGDNLETLAKKYRTTIQVIIEMNDLNTRYLELGQVLILPVVKNKIHQMYRLSF